MKKLEKRPTRKGYPIMPYLIGLFVTVIVLVLLSYLVDLRNRDALNMSDYPQSYATETATHEN